MRIPQCYKVLNVPSDASWYDIKQAYRELAKKYHPDKNLDHPQYGSQFKSISQAYRILESYFKIRKHRSTTQNFDTGPNPNSNPNTKPQPIQSLEGEGDLFGYKNFRKPKSWFEKWKREFHDALFKYEKKWLPLDVYQGVTVDSTIAENGGIVKIKTSKEIFKVRIPAGIRNRAELKIPERGQKSFFSSKRGDLLLKIRILPGGSGQPGSTNLFYEMKIRKEDLGKGKVFTLHTIQGSIKFFIPRKTYDGENFILKAHHESSGSSKINHVLTIRLI